MRRPKIEVYSYKGDRASKWIRAIVLVVLAFILAFTASAVCVLRGAHTQIEDEPDVMIILGCMVYPSGPSVMLRDRLNTALDYLNEHPGMPVIVTGGKGDDEHQSEAQAMHDYLTARGIPSEQIIMEDKATNTLENLKYSQTILEELDCGTKQEFLVVSNGFHLTRTRMLWERVMGEQESLNTLAAPSTHLPSWLKMCVREPLALIKSFVLDR